MHPSDPKAKQPANNPWDPAWTGRVAAPVRTNPRPFLTRVAQPAVAGYPSY